MQTATDTILPPSQEQPTVETASTEPRISEPTEPIYCAEQIRVPPELPDILKNFTKHILRSQPKDIYQCAYDYFGKHVKLHQQTLSQGPTTTSASISYLQLESLWLRIEKMGSELNAFLAKNDLLQQCKDIGISPAAASEFMAVGGWKDAIPGLHFWALVCANASGSLLGCLEDTIALFSDQGKVKVDPFRVVFRYLAERDHQVTADKVERINEVLGLTEEFCSEIRLRQVLEQMFSH